MDQLLADVETIRHDVNSLKAGSASDYPWIRRRTTASAEPPDVRGGIGFSADEPAGETSRGAGGRKKLPLRLNGPLGAIGYKDRLIFDETMATHEEYKFNGVKGGVAWKTKLERHFIARAPVLRDILEFAELEDMVEVTADRFRLAVGGFLSEDQVMAVNAAIWGFLAGCVNGAAEAIFDTAEQLNGLDAWRRLVRHIDHGREINLEMLRREMKHVQNRVIKDIFGIEEGIANFDNAIGRYTKAGGDPIRDSEKKSDLLAILPDAIRKDLLWHAADGGPYETFRNMILAQTQKIILNTRRGINNVNAVDENETLLKLVKKMQENPNDNEEGTSGILDDIIGAIQARRGRFGQKSGGGNRGTGGGGNGGTGGGAKRPGTERLPRNCANCGGTHAEIKCPHPEVARDKRKCWTCQGTGHSSKDCPKKAKRLTGAVRTVEEEEPLLMAISSDGFVPARRTARPVPRPATLGDFLSKNAFADLSRREPARAAAPGDDSNRVVSPPRSPGQKTSLFSQKATPKTILFSQKVSRAIASWTFTLKPQATRRKKYCGVSMTSRVSGCFNRYRS